MNEILQQIGHLIVDTNYRFDPAVEDLIYAQDLENGMVVLVETMHRSHYSPEYTDLIPREREIQNRWCEVTNLQFSAGKEEVYFIGVYADGQKVVRRSERFYGWLVKLEQEVKPDPAPKWEKLSEPETMPESPASHEPRSSFQNYMQAGN